MMWKEIMIEFEVSFDGKGQSTEDSSIKPEIEPIEEIESMSAVRDWSSKCLVRVSIDDG